MKALRYEDYLPLRWRQVEVLPSGQELERITRENGRLLQLLPSLEGAAEYLHDEDPPPRHIQVLEMRLQLLTELLADLLAQSRPLPLSRRIVITPESLEWLDEEPPAVGVSLLVEVYLNHLLPRPLVLPVEVVAVEAEADEQCVSAQLRVNTESAQAELEKLIFRHHRRMVASQRQR